MCGLPVLHSSVLKCVVSPQEHVKRLDTATVGRLLCAWLSHSAPSQTDYNEYNWLSVKTNVMQVSHARKLDRKETEYKL